MAPSQTERPPITTRPLAQGDGWRVEEVTCRCGPADRAFEERHDRISIAAVLGGTFTYRTACGRVLMMPGSLLLGNAGTCFECGHEHGTGDRCVAFLFAAELAEETVRGLRGVTGTRFKNSRVPPLESLLPVLVEARTLARTPDPLRAEQVALDLLAAAFEFDQDAAETPPQARDEARTADALRIVEDRYAEPLTVAELAREVGLGRRRFASVFRQLVGVTPYHYILNRRLHAAAGRLCDEQASVLDIALDVGFGDLSEFTRRFHERFGEPPARYRRGRRSAPVTIMGAM